MPRQKSQIASKILADKAVSINNVMISFDDVITNNLRIGNGFFVPRQLLQPKSTFEFRDSFRAIFEK